MLHKLSLDANSIAISYWPIGVHKYIFIGQANFATL